jgi:hypothetical protein
MCVRCRRVEEGPDWASRGKKIGTLTRTTLTRENRQIRLARTQIGVAARSEVLIPSATGVPTLQKAVMHTRRTMMLGATIAQPQAYGQFPAPGMARRPVQLSPGWCRVDKSLSATWVLRLSLLCRSCAVMTRKSYVSNPIVFFVM